MVKDLSPTTDPGKFNLQIDGVDRKTGADVGDGGTTGVQTVDTGTHTVGETAGTGTDLADYTLVDQLQRHGASAAATRASAGRSTSVSYGDDVVCTITNTRKTGTIEVVKDLSPATDPGKFDLQIDGSTARTARTSATAARPGCMTVNTGNHTVGETAGTGTTLADYTSSISCARPRRRRATGDEPR